MEHGVLVESLDPRWIIRPPNSEGPDADFDPRLDLVNGRIQRLNELIHVFASPFTPVEIAASASVAVVAFVVWKRQVHPVLAPGWVRVEIVVEVDSIDVIAAHDIEHDALNVIAGVRNSGVEPLVESVR